VLRPSGWERNFRHLIQNAENVCSGDLFHFSAKNLTASDKTYLFSNVNKGMTTCYKHRYAQQVIFVLCTIVRNFQHHGTFSRITGEWYVGWIWKEAPVFSESTIPVLFRRVEETTKNLRKNSP